MNDGQSRWPHFARTVDVLLAVVLGRDDLADSSLAEAGEQRSERFLAMAAATTGTLVTMELSNPARDLKLALSQIDRDVEARLELLGYGARNVWTGHRAQLVFSGVGKRLLLQFDRSGIASGLIAEVSVDELADSPIELFLLD